MDKPAEWRKMLLEYRLDELDETRREEVDALLISDPEFAAAMQEAEYDLLDAYAANELDPAERLRVETALHPGGRFSPAAPSRVIPTPASAKIVPEPARHQPSNRWMWAIAAILLVAAAIAFSLRRSQPNPPEQAIANPHQIQLAVPAPAPQPPAQPAPSIAPIKPHPASTLATLVLPGALRSQDALPLTIAPGVATVRFVWPSTDQSNAANYELQVVGDDGTAICRSHASPSRNRALNFDCPSAAIPSGPSFVRIVALPSTPDAAPLLEITLSVARK